MLETSLALQGDVRQRDVVFLFTDAKEAGLLGVRAFFASHPLASRIGSHCFSRASVCLEGMSLFVSSGVAENEGAVVRNQERVSTQQHISHCVQCGQLIESAECGPSIDGPSKRKMSAKLCEGGFDLFLSFISIVGVDFLEIFQKTGKSHVAMLSRKNPVCTVIYGAANLLFRLFLASSQDDLFFKSK